MGEEVLRVFSICHDFQYNERSIGTYHKVQVGFWFIRVAPHSWLVWNFSKIIGFLINNSDFRYVHRKLDLVGEIKGHVPYTYDR